MKRFWESEDRSNPIYQVSTTLKESDSKHARCLMVDNVWLAYSQAGLENQAVESRAGKHPVAGSVFIRPRSQALALLPPQDSQYD